jgi:hypothetical protein
VAAPMMTSSYPYQVSLLGCVEPTRLECVVILSVDCKKRLLGVRLISLPPLALASVSLRSPVGR